MLGTSSNLLHTSTGHYAIPIGKEKALLHQLEHEDVNVTLVTNGISNDDKRKVALKLHRQFSHPSVKKMLKLIQSSSFCNDEDLKTEILRVSENCKTCLVYKKPASVPTVALPLATEFNECEAMDLKHYKNDIWLLHLIDHATRFSASSVIKSKKSDVIIEQIYKIWISIFGAPVKFLSDNGGEFNNAEFRGMCESLNITVKTTAAESLWSNGLCERHNAVLADMLMRTLHECNCKLETALA